MSTQSRLVGGKEQAYLGSELDWGFVAEPNPQLNGRAIPYSMGKVLGGFGHKRIDLVAGPSSGLGCFRRRGG